MGVQIASTSRSVASVEGSLADAVVQRIMTRRGRGSLRLMMMMMIRIIRRSAGTAIIEKGVMMLMLVRMMKMLVRGECLEIDGADGRIDEHLDIAE